MANVARRTHRLHSRGFAGHHFHGAMRGAHSRDPLTIARHSMGRQPSVI
jgi:hypothetical protein